MADTMQEALRLQAYPRLLEERDELRKELAEVLEIAIARGESLGYYEADEDYRLRLEELKRK